MEDLCDIDVSMQWLRQRVAVNFFKQLLLGDFHIHGQPQTSAVFEKLHSSVEKIKIGERTWSSWFSGTFVKMKASKAKLLDKLARECIDLKNEDGSHAGKLPEHFFEELIHGGFVVRLNEKIDSSHIRQVLMLRAQDYIPMSPLHLHLDAIEINTLTKDVCGIPWSEVTEIAAYRIFNLLTDIWGPRSGSIYSSFSSPLKLRWDSANTDERKHIREWYARFKPDLFEEKFHAGACPNWDQIGVGSDVAFQHIYKALFAMAADSDFLVADRLNSWTFDLASAALTMHALAWADRYSTFGFSITDEMLFWGAFDHVFFDQDTDEVDEWHLRNAMKCCSAEWDEKALSVFTAARNMYQAELSEYGISTNDVMKIVEKSSAAHPLIYYGDYDSNNLPQV